MSDTLFPFWRIILSNKITISAKKREKCLVFNEKMINLRLYVEQTICRIQMVFINLKSIIMKKNFKLTALLLSATIFLSSCIGSFGLTNKVLDWNNGIGNKFVNELVFIALHIVPVYEISVFIDAVVLNSIEFWTGDNLVAEPGDTKIVKNSAGEDIQIVATENGYTVSNGETAMNFVFDKEQQIWSAEYNNQLTNLVKLNGDNTAQIFVGEDVVDVNLDAQGINMAYMLMNNSFAMK